MNDLENLRALAAIARELRKSGVLRVECGSIKLEMAPEEPEAGEFDPLALSAGPPKLTFPDFSGQKPQKTSDAE